jgi:hypothetical protein
LICGLPELLFAVLLGRFSCFWLALVTENRDPDIDSAFLGSSYYVELLIFSEIPFFLVGAGMITLIADEIF